MRQGTIFIQNGKKIMHSSHPKSILCYVISPDIYSSL